MQILLVHLTSTPTSICSNWSSLGRQRDWRSTILRRHRHELPAKPSCSVAAGRGPNTHPESEKKLGDGTQGPRNHVQVQKGSWHTTYLSSESSIVWYVHTSYLKSWKFIHFEFANMEFPKRRTLLQYDIPTKLCGFIVHNKDPCPNVQYARLRMSACVLKKQPWCQLPCPEFGQHPPLLQVFHRWNLNIFHAWMLPLYTYTRWFIARGTPKWERLTKKCGPEKKQWVAYSKCGKKKNKTQLSIYISYNIYIYIPQIRNIILPWKCQCLFTGIFFS